MLWWLVPVLVLAAVGLGVAWRSSGRAAPRTPPVRPVEAAAAHVDRNAPHTSSTCQQSGFDNQLGW